MQVHTHFRMQKGKGTYAPLDRVVVGGGDENLSLRHAVLHQLGRRDDVERELAPIERAGDFL